MSQPKQLHEGRWLSRQRIWQIQHIEQGLCSLCSERAVYDGTMCQAHLDSRRERHRREGNYHARSESGLGRPTLEDIAARG